MQFKNYIFPIKDSRLFLELILSISFFLVMTSATFSQVNFGVKAPYKTIYFGQRIDFGTLEQTFSWTVSHSLEGIAPVHLKGNEINNYVFSKPGTYEIKFSENKKHTDDCNHAPFDASMTVEVSPVKMIFDFSHIVFSEKIQRGRFCDDIEISVPVNVSFSGKKSATFISPDVMVAGVGSRIIAKPVQKEIVLKEGIQLLKYKLSGVANDEAYLMFDFVDINNQVQCYNLPQIIN